jgi:hypothetical protein
MSSNPSLPQSLQSVQLVLKGNTSDYALILCGSAAPSAQAESLPLRAEHDEVIEAFAPDGADEALDMAVLPR